MRRRKVFWKQNARGFKCPALVAHKEFTRIEREHGSVSPAVVVAEAAKKRNPLHDDIYLDDDSTAAQKHRIAIARQMIRSLAVIHVHGDRKIETRAVISVCTESEPARSYRTTRVVMADPESREAVLAEALDRFRALKREYAHLSELAAVFREIDRLGD